MIDPYALLMSLVVGPATKSILSVPLGATCTIFTELVVFLTLILISYDDEAIDGKPNNIVPPEASTRAKVVVEAILCANPVKIKYCGIPYRLLANRYPV